MVALSPVMPVAAAPDSLPAAQVGANPVQKVDFYRLLADGVQNVSSDVVDADKLVREFAVSDSVPVHHVTYALEQARLSLNLMVQVRNRLVEAYQQMMNMQL
jgi:flagellar hook-basal body complex protein FliE